MKTLITFIALFLATTHAQAQTKDRSFSAPDYICNFTYTPTAAEVAEAHGDSTPEVFSVVVTTDKDQTTNDHMAVAVIGNIDSSLKPFEMGTVLLGTIDEPKSFHSNNGHTDTTIELKKTDAHLTMKGTDPNGKPFEAVSTGSCNHIQYQESIGSHN